MTAEVSIDLQCEGRVTLIAYAYFSRASAWVSSAWGSKLRCLIRSSSEIGSFGKRAVKDSYQEVSKACKWRRILRDISSVQVVK